MWFDVNSCITRQDDDDSNLVHWLISRWTGVGRADGDGGFGCDEVKMSARA